MARAGRQLPAQRNDRHALRGGQNPAYRPAPPSPAFIMAGVTGRRCMQNAVRRHGRRPGPLRACPSGCEDRPDGPSCHASPPRLPGMPDAGQGVKPQRQSFAARPGQKGRRCWRCVQGRDVAGRSTRHPGVALPHTGDRWSARKTADRPRFFHNCCRSVAKNSMLVDGLLS